MNKKLVILRDRSEMLAKCRQFFYERAILEVDCPAISQAASIDANIDLIGVRDHSKWRYLHSSPEYGMKRLIADGLGEIYQLSHVFREGEESCKHNPEFSLAEWYRLNISFEQMMEETVQFVRLFLGELPFKILSYREAFHVYAGIDYLKASPQDLIDFLLSHEIQPYPEIMEEGKDALLNLILGSLIEPKLGQDGTLCVLAYYPHTQAALAKTCQRGEELAAERFEIYYTGMELANGYHELTDASEQRKRLLEANQQRKQAGKEILPIDENFLNALKKGLPECCGVAVGFDRLMMLKHKLEDINQVIPFSWNHA
jgi:elongation factor P--(R)-beta-lysine ligase